MEKPIILLEVPEGFIIDDSAISKFKESLGCDNLIIRGTDKFFIEYLTIYSESCFVNKTKFKTLEELL